MVEQSRGSVDDLMMHAKARTTGETQDDLAKILVSVAKLITAPPTLVLPFKNKLSGNSVNMLKLEFHCKT